MAPPLEMAVRVLAKAGFLRTLPMASGRPDLSWKYFRAAAYWER